MKQTLSIFGLAVLLSVTGCKSTQTTAPYEYQASIVRTSHGIPHITAKDYPSLGFGEGFTAAQDHVCNIADGIVVARGERAKYHGMGAKKKHFKSDVVVKALGIPKRAAEALKNESDENRAWLKGYADGYNHYLQEIGVENIGSWCQGAEWVKPISSADLFARFVTLANTAPRIAGMLVSAQPPESNGIKVSQVELLDQADKLKGKYLGSNAWAFGKDRTENGRGLLIGNPHYPWSGTDRFWEKHLKIPGRLNVYGVHLIGAPGVAIGFNEKVGWSHTVSDSERVAFYALKLVPNNPTMYYYDDEVRAMEPKTVNVEVKGKSEPVKHTMWFSHYGPMIQLPGVAWNKKMAISMRDANLNNYNLMPQWKAMNEAQGMDELKQAHKTWNAMPWVNTMATSHDGRAVYIDGSNVGRLSNEAIALWKKRVKEDKLAKSIFAKTRFIVLDGSDSRYEWQTHPESVIEGNVPYVEKPVQDRSDYIFNANDSYWLTNLDAPMKGYSPLYGPDDTPRTLRTRMNAKIVSNTSETGYAGKDGKFSLKEIQHALLNNDSLTAKLLLDPLVESCKENSSIETAGEKVDITPACQALSKYDGHLNLESRGAVLFREWITQYPYHQTFIKGDLFEVGFDANDPINTPRGLANKTLALVNLAKAMQVLNNSGIALDASMGDTQFAYRGRHKVAIHGGKNEEGIANIIGQRVYDSMAKQIRGNSVKGSRHLKDIGYAITFGASFVMSLSYTDEGPYAEAFLTYSQSGDPDSPHYADQTKLFSKKQWRPILFKEQDIKASVQSSQELRLIRK